ncbi:TetR/AcrR family transcriptional regulator [Methanobrevibacter sp.]|uniref:TetR/AcrR family transcriptional regulator n=1 Tax=Methanobrevibacter sp. TaxID=66852 RepID=UPI00388E1F08
MTKDKILDVSIDLFSKYGYDGVSVRQIAREVGIRESSIYNHYSNKQAILKAILDYYVEEMISDDIPLEQASLNLDRGFDYFYKAGCDAFLSKLKKDRMMKITRLFFIESYHNDEVKNFLKEAIINAPVKGWIDLFNLMKAKNIIREDCDVKQLSESFFYYGMFLLYEHFILNYPEDDEEFLKNFLSKTENHAKIIFNSARVRGDGHENKA